MLVKRNFSRVHVFWSDSRVVITFLCCLKKKNFKKRFLEALRFSSLRVSSSTANGDVGEFRYRDLIMKILGSRLYPFNLRIKLKNIKKRLRKLFLSTTRLGNPLLYNALRDVIKSNKYGAIVTSEGKIKRTLHFLNKVELLGGKEMRHLVSRALRLKNGEIYCVCKDVLCDWKLRR